MTWCWKKESPIGWHWSYRQSSAKRCNEDTWSFLKGSENTGGSVCFVDLLFFLVPCSCLACQFVASNEHLSGDFHSNTLLGNKEEDHWFQFVQGNIGFPKTINVMWIYSQSCLDPFKWCPLLVWHLALWWTLQAAHDLTFGTRHWGWDGNDCWGPIDLCISSSSVHWICRDLCRLQSALKRRGTSIGGMSNDEQWWPKWSEMYVFQVAWACLSIIFSLRAIFQKIHIGVRLGSDVQAISRRPVSRGFRAGSQEDWRIQSDFHGEHLFFFPTKTSQNCNFWGEHMWTWWSSNINSWIFGCRIFGESSYLHSFPRLATTLLLPQLLHSKVRIEVCNEWLLI